MYYQCVRSFPLKFIQRACLLSRIICIAVKVHIPSLWVPIVMPKMQTHVLHIRDIARMHVTIFLKTLKKC